MFNPKGISSENTTQVLNISQSINVVEISGSISPTNNNSFSLGQSNKVFNTIHANHISASGNITASFTSTASFGRFEGDGSGLSNITAESVTFANVSGKPTLFSGSAQVDPAEALLTSNVVSASVLSSGAQGTITLTNNGVAANVDSGLQVGDSPTFAGLTTTGDVVIQGKLTAETYAVSSSVTHMTRSFSSGSTIFGDTADDTHQFTGSILIGGGSVSPSSISGSLGTNATLIRGLTSSTISGSFNVSQLPSGTISGSAQVVSVLPSGTISGSVQVVSVLPSGTISGSGQIDMTWTLGSDGTDHYTFDGPGLIGAENDPTLYLTRGEQYRFINKMGAHPFRIQSDPNGSTGTAYNDGVTNNDVQDGVLVWDVQFDAPSILYYQCTSHPNMGGPIYVSNPTDYLEKLGDNVVSGSDQVKSLLPASTISGSFGNQRVGTTDSVLFNHITGSGNISGSSTSTGSIGSLIVDGASIDFSNLPASDPNVAGRLYNDGGTVKISAG